MSPEQGFSGYMEEKFEMLKKVEMERIAGS